VPVITKIKCLQTLGSSSTGVCMIISAKDNAKIIVSICTKNLFISKKTHLSVVVFSSQIQFLRTKGQLPSYTVNGFDEKKGKVSPNVEGANTNYSGTHPKTSIRMHGSQGPQVKGYRRTHIANTGVDSRFSTTVFLSVFPTNVWKRKLKKN